MERPSRRRQGRPERPPQAESLPHCQFTVVVAVAELFVAVGSKTNELTLAVSVTEWPDLTVTSTTMLTVNAMPLASDGAVQVTLPLAAPTAGVLHEPELVAALTNVVPLGTLSLSVTTSAVLGPLLVTTRV